MIRLVAEGAGGERVRRALTAGRPLRLGRAPALPPAGGEDTLSIPWDVRISGDHARLCWDGERLAVERLDPARNPIFFRGDRVNRFSLVPGELFVVGGTTFRLVADRASAPADEPTPVNVVGYSVEDLGRTRFRDAEARLEVLSSLHHVIRGAAEEADLTLQLTMLLLDGVPTAATAAVVRIVPPETGGEAPEIAICDWESRDAGGPEFRPSRRLVLDAVQIRRQSVCHFWNRAGAANLDYSVMADLDWATCTPVPGEACAGWGLYLAGRSPADSGFAALDLKPDLKFVELVAEVLGALRDLRQLQSRQALLGRFFSPLTLPLLASPQGEQALAPRQTRITVLFCDLRGFSREAARSRGDLLGLLRRVSHALDVMTECIHAQDGVIGDFQGDAALAFWGWPIDRTDTVAAAAHAALDIRRRFSATQQSPDSPLSGFQCGIGIATGEGVAGRLGTSGQFKIDVFGPVVNLASRLEGITKQLRVPILLDEATAQQLAEGGHGSWARLRRVARIRPYGLDEAVTVSELLPPAGGASRLADGDLLQYEAALDAFQAGRWDEAFALFQEIPAWDQGKDFVTGHILRHKRQPPAAWDGVIQLDSK